MTDTPPQPSGEEIAPGIFLPKSALRFGYSRSSGPGGQHVNKVATKVRLHLQLDDLDEQLTKSAMRRLRKLAGSMVTDTGKLIITSDDSRSQHSNKQDCLDKLRALIVEARKTPKKRRKTRPSRAAKQRRLDEKKRRGQRKEARGKRFDDA